jgi:hypothetical protein
LLGPGRGLRERAVSEIHVFGVLRVLRRVERRVGKGVQVTLDVGVLVRFEGFRRTPSLVDDLVADDDRAVLPEGDCDPVAGTSVEDRVLS